MLKSDIKPETDQGLMMNMCAVAGLASSGTARDAASSLRSALTRPIGLPASAAPPASAAYSRDREMAVCMSMAARGAKMIVARSTRGLFAPPSRLSLRPVAPQNIANREITMIAAARVAATELIKMSAMLDVRKFVCEDTFELLVVQAAQDTLGGSNGSVVGVTPGCEGVRRRLGDDVNARHWQASPSRKAAYYLMQAMTGSDFLRPVHPQNDLVREPIRREVRSGGKQEANEHPLGAAKRVADQQKQGAHRTQQQSCFHHVRHSSVRFIQNRFEMGPSYPVFSNDPCFQTLRSQLGSQAKRRKQRTRGV